MWCMWTLVWWQVGCSGHTPPQVVEFAPAPPLAIAGWADGVSRLMKQVRRRPITGCSSHPPQPPVGGGGSGLPCASMWVGRRGRRPAGADVEEEGVGDDAPPAPPAPPPPCPQEETPPPPSDTDAPPPPKAPLHSQPRTSCCCCHQGRMRGDVSKWLQLQQSDPWQVRALFAEAARRGMDQRLVWSQEGKRTAEMESERLRHERDKLREEMDRLQPKVNTLEREARRSKGGRGLGPMTEGESESHRGWVGGGGGGAATAPNPTGTRFLLAGAHVRHTQAEAARGQMSVVATGVRMMLCHTTCK